MIAATIQQQIGRKAFFMMGAHTLVDHGNAFSFKVRGAGRGCANYIKVTLNAHDFYDVECLRLWGLNVKTISTHTDVGAENLRGLIESETGLCTSL